MQRIVTILFIACFLSSFVTSAAATDNVVTKKDLKSFNLNIDDKPLISKVPVESRAFSLDDDEPSAGGDFIDRFHVKPEINYGRKDDDYNDRLDQYETEVKLKVKVPVDINFK